MIHYQTLYLVCYYTEEDRTVIPLSDIGGLDIRTRNGLYPLLFVNALYMFFICSVYVLMASAKERYWRPTFDKLAGKF